MAIDPDLSYVNEDGKLVTGAAAFNHHVYTENDSLMLPMELFIA